ENDFQYKMVPNYWTSPDGGNPKGYDEMPTGVPDKRWRKNNGYNDKNILLKWQDKNWFVKLNYTDNVTHTPQAIDPYFPRIDSSEEWKDYVGRGWDADSAMMGGTIDTKKMELSFGRRQQAGNLEWGWQLGTTHQNKQALFAELMDGLMFGTNTFKNNIYNASVDGTWKMGNHLLEFLLSGSKETMDVGFATNYTYSTGYNIDRYKDYFLPKYNMSNYYFQLQDTMKLDDSGSLTFTPLVRSQRSDMGIEIQNGKGWLNSYNLAL
ncbi:hypothetical protein, partial [Pectinatus frisingensis]